ncbi:MAG: CoA transferase [Lachnospiraceae bacterium]|nr:CoA transferase [Lachnospiraceae bacterium]
MGKKIYEGIRVIEIGSDRCAFCSKLLADLGAEVIKIEPEKGDTTRKIAPFLNDQEGIENSLFHAFYNAGKKSVVLDYCGKDKDTFLKLIQTADVLIEATKPGYLDRFALGYEELKKVNPGLVMCSITPFGQKGPWKEWEAPSDIILYAAGGAMYELGDKDKPPIQLGYHFLTNGTNLYALTGIAGALLAREKQGEGSYIDISIIEVAAAWRGSELGFTQQAPDYRVCQRKGSQGIMIPANFYECKDGHAFIMASGRWPEMIQWMKDVGMDIRGKDDPKYLPDQGFNKYLWEEIDEINGMVNELTRHYTMNELTVEGQKRKIPVGPAETMETVLKNEQYIGRNYFKEIDSPVLGTAKYPIRAIGFTQGEMLTDRPAPLLGQHTESVLNEIAVGEKKQFVKKQELHKLLEGIVVLDLGWVVAGPHCGRILTDLGATVIRIESASRPDPMRIDARRYGISEKDAMQEGGWCFQDNNRNKMDLGINLKTAKGRQILEEMVAKADIVICNFAPRGFHSMKIDYESLKEYKEDIIVINASGLGDWGPYSSYMTFAPVLSCYTGITSLMGYEGHGPYGYPGPFADYTGGVCMSAAALVALYYRDKTGKGQFVDLCQAEATIQNLGPQLLDWQLNHRIPDMYGNHHTYGQMVPHNCYECKTDNTWLVLAIADDLQWKQLTMILGQDFPELMNKEYCSFAGRKEHETEIDQLLKYAFRTKEAAEIAVILQYAGVPASKVHSTWDTLYDNPQLKELDYFKKIELADNGLEPKHFLVTGPLIHSSFGDPQKYIQGPAFARDNKYLIKTVLGHDDSFLKDAEEEHVFS